MGKRTVVSRTQLVPYVSTFHCELDGWLGDDLVESFPCFLVTEKLSAALGAERLSGFELGEAEITISPEFKKRNPGRRLPRFRWLKITGKPNRDDFWMESDQSIAVSRAAFELLQQFRLDHCQVRAEVKHGNEDK